MRVLVAYTVLGFTGFFVTVASLPVWLVGRGTPASVAGLVTTVLLVFTVGLQSAVPKLVSRFGLGPVIGVGLVALGAPSLLLLIDGGLGWVLAISAVRGAGFGTLTVLGSAMTASIVPPERRGESIGAYGLAVAVPNLLAVPGGVALVAAGQFPAVALIGAAPLAALAVVPALAGRVGPMRDGSASPTGSRRAAAKAAVAPSLVLMVITLAGGGITTFLPIARPDGALATVALLVYGVTGALSRWRAGAIADRSGTGTVLPASSVLVVIGMVGVAGGLLASGPAGWLLVVGCSAVMGVGYGSAQNLTLVAAFARARQQETATVSSVWNIGFDAGTALGAAAVGVLAAALEIPGAFGVTAALVALSLPLAVTSGRAVPALPETRP